MEIKREERGSPSKATLIKIAIIRVFSNHNMVEEPYVEELRTLLDSFGEDVVFGTRISVAAGMIVADDDGACMSEESSRK